MIKWEIYPVSLPYHWLKSYFDIGLICNSLSIEVWSIALQFAEKSPHLFRWPGQRGDRVETWEFSEMMVVFHPGMKHHLWSWLCQIEAIEVHHLVPCCDKILHKLMR